MLFRIFVVVALVVGLVVTPGSPAAAETPTAFITNSASNTVAVIDSTANTVEPRHARRTAGHTAQRLLAVPTGPAPQDQPLELTIG